MRKQDWAAHKEALRELRLRHQDEYHQILAKKMRSKAMDLESAVDRAYLDSTCPYCGIRQVVVTSGEAPEDLIKNTWRHHIRVTHIDGDVGS